MVDLLNFLYIQLGGKVKVKDEDLLKMCTAAIPS